MTLRFGLAALCLLRSGPGCLGPSRGRDLANTCLMGLMSLCWGSGCRSMATNWALPAIRPSLWRSSRWSLRLRRPCSCANISGPAGGGFRAGLCGVAVLHGVWRRDFQWIGLVPSLIFVSSFVSEAAYSVMGKPIVGRASLMKMLAISLLVGTAANLLIDGPSTLTAARLLPPGLVFACWLAVVCTAIGYSVWFDRHP